MRRLALLLSAASVLIAAAPADPDLPRRAWLGTRFAPPGEAAGRVVAEVRPQSTAASLGMRAGDLIPLSELERLWRGDQQTPLAGAPVTMTVQRGGVATTLSGKAVARPRESYDDADTRYGSVAFGGGRLRDILVLPKGVENPPVVYLIQGYTCTTAEGLDPQHVHRQVIAALLEAGIGTYRVEKPGVGDSQGPLQCRDIDYQTELDAFRAAYAHLIEAHGVPLDRLFLLGHSMGGLQAPMLAAERAPRGVAVYGTVLRNWGDYWLDMDAIQPFLLTGADPAATADRAARSREVISRFFFDDESPQQIAAESPEMAEATRVSLEWDGGDQVAARHYRYFQQIADVNFFAQWRDARTHVLSLYGESDVIALFDTDQRLIADVVNHYRPGTARYIGVPDTGHGMELAGNRAALRTSEGQNAPAPFNPKVPQILIDWIREVMAKPPVA